MPARTGPAKRVGSFGAGAAKARRTTAKSKAASNRRNTITIRKIVSSMKESKFFDAMDKVGVALTVDSTAAFGTFGLGTTSVKFVPGSSTTLTYGGNITNLEMLKPFSTNSTISTQGWQRANALNGKHCIPMQGKVVLNFRRTPQEITGGTSPEKNLMATAGPLHVRVIRVTAKGGASTLVQYDPKQDLFQTQWGEDCGVQAGSHQPTSSDLATIPINRDKYTVLDDIKFSLARPSSYEMPATTNAGHTVVPAGYPATSKVITLHPQLAARKGGVVQYLDPNDGATSTALDGQRREFILVHAWYPGIANRSTIASILPLDLLCHVTPTSRFKDGQ